MLIDKNFVEINGQLEYHPLLDYIRSGNYNLDPPNNVVTLAANQRSNYLPLTARLDGYYILTKMMAERTGDATIRVKDPARGVFWSNNEVHLDTVVGAGGLPGLLDPEKFVLNPTQPLLVDLRDISGAPNVIRLAFGGAKLYYQSAPQAEVKKFLGQRSLITYPYWQTPDNGAFTIAANGTSQQFATVSSDFDFICYKINAVSDEDFTVEIKYRGDTLSNNAQIHSNVATGNAQFPYILPQPTMFRRNEIIELNFTNLSPINPNVVYFTMIGRAIMLHR